jgi:hypothetical protein
MAKLLECIIQNNEGEKIRLKVVEKNDKHDFSNYIIGEDAKMSIKVRDAIEVGEKFFTIENEKYKIINYKIYDDSYCIIRTNLTFDLSHRYMYYDIYLYNSRNKCDIRKHNVVPATALVRTDKHKTIPINIDHCLDCDKHYVNRLSLSMFERKYGELEACKIDEVPIDRKNDYENDSYGRRQQSLLTKYGYNVSQVNNLSARERRRILIRVLESGDMSKPEIIDHLEYLIRERSERKQMEVAISRWADDLKFINEYKMNEQVVINGQLVSKDKYHRK